MRNKNIPKNMLQISSNVFHFSRRCCFYQRFLARQREWHEAVDQLLQEVDEALKSRELENSKVMENPGLLAVGSLLCETSYPGKHPIGLKCLS